MRAPESGAERPVAAVIGDVVRSKRAKDRAALHRALVERMDHVNALVPAEQGLDVTFGDEFQAVYASVADALLASMLLRLSLLPRADTRYGIGWGAISIYEPDRRPIVQDGPGWWAARQAITHVKAQEGRKAHARRLRTWFVDQAGPAEASPSHCVNAFLLCRDELIGRQTDRGRRLLLGWLTGSTQAELAEGEGVTQSAVSQHLASSGSYAVRDAHEQIKEMAAWTSSRS